MGPVSHEPYVLRRRINTLAVLYGPLEHVAELCFAAQVVRSHKVHHAPVFQKVVLEGITCGINYL